MRKCTSNQICHAAFHRTLWLYFAEQNAKYLILNVFAMQSYNDSISIWAIHKILQLRPLSLKICLSYNISCQCAASYEIVRGKIWDFHINFYLLENVIFKKYNAVRS